MSSDIYTEAFYDVTTDGSIEGANTILKLLWKYKTFESVIDIGCGVGAWLKVASMLGANMLCGIEGAYFPKDKFLLEQDALRVADLNDTIRATSKFDLCICLEVAEHLHPDRAPGLIRDLTGLSDIVLFSAAIPFQGGDGHLNEMWPEFWALLFSKCGYLPWDGLRKLVWNCREIPWWYRQNVILYIRDHAWEGVLPTARHDDPLQLTKIHPESYLWNVRRRNRKLKTDYETDLRVFYSCSDGKDITNPGYGPEFPAPRVEAEDAA